MTWWMWLLAFAISLDLISKAIRIELLEERARKMERWAWQAHNDIERLRSRKDGGA